MLLDDEQLIPGETAALRDDCSVRQVFVGFAQRSSVWPYKRIEPLDDGQDLRKNDIEGMELPDMGQFVGQDPVEGSVGGLRFVEEYVIEERERFAGMTAEDDPQAAVPLTAAPPRHQDETAYPDEKEKKEEPGAGGIDGEKDVEEARGAWRSEDRRRVRMGDRKSVV
jgi:hypothetical protein